MGEDAEPGRAPGAAQDAWRLQHHAMRQPLNALGLFCAALKMQPLSAAQQPLVAGIAEAAQDIERLVDAHFAALAGLPALPPLAAAPAQGTCPTLTAVGTVPPMVCRMMSRSLLAPVYRMVPSRLMSREL